MTMKYEEIIEVIKSLAKSQGFYGRLLASIEALSDSDKLEFISALEKENFKDPVDVVMFFEA